MQMIQQILLSLLIAIPVKALDNPATITVGSKKFTENIILGEMITLLAEDLGYSAEHQRQLGGTRILWNALLSGDIDIYPEYTGTLHKEILQTDEQEKQSLDEILADFDISISPPLGFNNTYAIGMKSEETERLDIRSVSDLRDHPDLVLGFTNEFLDREDGWPGLQARYRLPQQNVRGLDHDLAYRGLGSSAIHVIDMYATDAEIIHYDLTALEDDLRYFPVYDAVILFRAELMNRAPDLVRRIHALAGHISESEMIAMNARVKLDKEPENKVAANFINKQLDLNVQSKAIGFWQRLWINTRAHLFMVLVSLSAAIITAIPLGVIAAKYRRTGSLILGMVGVIQTIPSLALLVFMIPLLGIGGPPAIVALFLYSLLPIVRNTHAGLHDIPEPIRESALALGLPPAARLRRIELPLASRSILAGVKTSAVINVGTATLGALIGAGGYGQPILTGIRLDDVGLILQGAIPAALMALSVQGLFDLLEILFVPKGLRLSSTGKQ